MNCFKFLLQIIIYYSIFKQIVSFHFYIINIAILKYMHTEIEVLQLKIDGTKSEIFQLEQKLLQKRIELKDIQNQMQKLKQESPTQKLNIYESKSTKNQPKTTPLEVNIEILPSKQGGQTQSLNKTNVEAKKYSQQQTNKQAHVIAKKQKQQQNSKIPIEVNIPKPPQNINPWTMRCSICKSRKHDITMCVKKTKSKKLYADYKCLICLNNQHWTQDCVKLVQKGPCSLCQHHTIQKCYRLENYLWYQNQFL